MKSLEELCGTEGTEATVGHLVRNLNCGCFNLFSNVWMCVCLGFVMCGCFDNCVGVLTIVWVF